MKKQTSPISALGKTLTKISNFIPKMISHAEYIYLSATHSAYRLQAASEKKHWRNKAKLSRYLNLATKYAQATGDVEIAETVDLLRRLAKIIVGHCDFFYNNDYDAREWKGQKFLTQFEAEIAHARSLVRTFKGAAS